MSDKKKCPECPPEGAPDWMLTYGDMVTLLLVFFITLFSLDDVVVPPDFMLLLASFDGLGALDGGLTLQADPLNALGNPVDSAVSDSNGVSFNKSLKLAQSLFKTEGESREVKVTITERGLIISLFTNSFFEPASAEIKKTEDNIKTFQKLSSFLQSRDLVSRDIRIEGHTDDTPVDPNGVWYSNWELSTARATSVLHLISSYGVNEKRLQVAGFSGFKPSVSNDTEEGRSFNRRIDVIILTDGHI